MATGDAERADVLIRLLIATNPRPVIVYLSDGDKGGADRRKYLFKLLKANTIPTVALPTGKTIEDLLPRADPLFVESVATYTFKVRDPERARTDPPREWTDKFVASYQAKGDLGVDKWANDTSKAILERSHSPAKIGFAREYAQLLNAPNVAITSADVAPILRLINDLQKHLNVPKLGATSSDVKILKR